MPAFVLDSELSAYIGIEPGIKYLSLHCTWDYLPSKDLCVYISVELGNDEFGVLHKIFIAHYTK